MKRLVPSQLVAVFFAAFTLLLNSQASANYTWSTLAGPISGPGTDDGPGASALFYYPRATAVDAAGNVYVADRENSIIRKITAAGVVSTLAGTPAMFNGPFSADGTGAAARFKRPGGVAVDAAGNVYVADTDNHTIRKITAAGVVTTVAGLAGTPGAVNDPANPLNARFNFPEAIAIDAAGILYVADMGNHIIRKITPAGAVTTLAGGAGMAGALDNANGANARFNSPKGIAVTAAGNFIYVADTGNHTIRRITAAGAVDTLAGGAGMAGAVDNANGANARFNSPEGITVTAAGNFIYVGDTGNHTVRQITAAGAVTTLAGNAAQPSGYVEGIGAAARFSSPRGLAVNGAGDLFVADAQNHAIRRITAAAVVTTFAGNPERFAYVDGTGAAARFSYPRGAAVDSSGNVYVADSGNHIIRKVTPAGVVTVFAGSPGNFGKTDDTGTFARFNLPHGICIDSSGNFYVADRNNHTIRKITPAGAVSTLAGNAGNAGSTDGTGTNALFNFPEGVAVDSSGNVYVADTGNHTIRRITPAGVVTTLAGFAANTGSTDGNGTNAKFNFPRGIAVDKGGTIYVADTDNHTIRKVTQAGDVTTYAGLAGTEGSSDGTRVAARFRYPRGLAVDRFSDLYVADTSNHIIRKIAISNGAVTTIGGLAGFSGQLSGVGAAARFNYPQGIAVSSNLDLYVCDFHRVVWGRPPTSTLNVTANLSPFTAFRGSPSATQSFTVSASALTSDVTVTAPTGFQISSSGSSFVQSLTFAKSSTGTVATRTVLVRMTESNQLGAKSGTLTVLSAGSTQSIALSGTVTEPQPTLTVSASALSGFSAAPGKASTAKTFTVSGIGLTADITVTAPSGFLISALGKPLAASLTLANSSQNTVTTTTISVVMAASSDLGVKSGTLAVESAGAAGKTVALSGAVAGLSVDVTSLTGFIATRTAASEAQSVTVSGVGLTSDVTVRAPAGFEISKDGAPFRSSFTIFRESDGTIAATIVDVRLRPSRSRGSKSGQMLITSSGAPTVIVSCSGRVE